MTTTDINKIAAEARTLLEGISKVNAKHDTLVADRNARVKPLLEKVHHTLTVLKQPVEGVTSWNAWAQKAGWSKRNLNFILNGRPSQKKKDGDKAGNSSSRQQQLTKLLDIIETAMPKNGTWEERLTAFYETVIEAAAEMREPVKPKKKAAKIKRLTLRDTHRALNAINKATGKDDGGTVDEQIVRVEKRLAAILALNDAEKKPQYAPWRTAKKHAEERLADLRQWKAEHEQALVDTHFQIENENSALCLRFESGMKLSTDINAVDCKGCLEHHARDKQLDAKKPIHFVRDGGWKTRCGTSAMSSTKRTSDPTQVTCKDCLKITKALTKEKQVDEIVEEFLAQDAINNLDEFRKAKSKVPESVKALAATVDAAEVPYDKEAYAKAENHSQKVCIKGSPENLQWIADLKHRREYLYIDPNEADDESEDCETEEDSEEEVV